MGSPVRRRAILGALGTGAAMLASGCGDDSSGPGPQVNRVPRGTGVLDPNHLAMSPVGDRLAVLHGKGVGIWSATGGAQVRELDLDVTRGLAWSPEGDLLAVGGTKGAIHLVDATDGSTTRTLTGHKPAGEAGGVLALAFGPDGSRLVSAGGDGDVRVWDTADGSSQTVDLRTRRPRSLTVSPDGSVLAVGGLDQPLEVVDLDDLEVTPVGACPAQTMGLGFTPDGTHLVASSTPMPKPGTVLLLSASDWSVVRELARDVKAQGLAVAPDGERVAVADAASRQVIVTPLDGGTPRSVEPPGDKPRAVRWSATGDEVFVLTSDGLTGWDPTTGRSTTTFEMESS